MRPCVTAGPAVRAPSCSLARVVALAAAVSGAQSCAVDDRNVSALDPAASAAAVPGASGSGATAGAGGTASLEPGGVTPNGAGQGGTGTSELSADVNSGAASAGEGGSGAAGDAAMGAGAPGSGAGGSAMSGAAGGSGTAPREVACSEQLLQNGDFDAGHSGWTERWDLRQPIVERGDAELAAQGVEPQSGDYLAWIGGLENEEFGQKHPSGLEQYVTIPAGAVSLVFSGYAWVEQSELGLTPFDWAVLEFWDPEATGEDDVLWQVQAWNDTSVTIGWVRFEEVETNVERFRGRTLPLRLDARPDGNGTMSVWLDSLRLEARCP